MKTVSSVNINIDNYRKLVRTYIDLHVYGSALFWADKIVALTEDAKDIYWLAQCMFLQKQYHRAAHLIRSRNLEKTHVLCTYLTVQCLFEANELTEALKVIDSVDNNYLFLSKDDVSSTPCSSDIDVLLDDIPKNGMDNRGLASIVINKHCILMFTVLKRLIL
ncbi:hypothetical protein NQ317_003904 [Molorchus minor]|uniref:Uncharacterized protein n=1 Tax=Molorchus minor TaxID=1323400 RepID=A0ABQ9J7N9_9CUCU|nr:hypothetical protein NQ317_003904 [Molorchus minor]